MKFSTWIKKAVKELRCEVGLHKYSKGEYRYQCTLCGYYTWHTFPKTKLPKEREQ